MKKWGLVAVLAAPVIFVPLALLTVGVLIATIAGAGTSVVGALGQGNATAQQRRSEDCVIGGRPVSGTQRQYVRAMIGVAKTMNVPRRGQIIATMVMLQETGIQNYANNGTSVFGAGYPEPGREFWLNVAKRSMKYPHDAVGHNADSVGLFQQRPSMGWGNNGSSTARTHPDAAIKRLLDPRWTSMAFFGGPQSRAPNSGLLDLKGWKSMTLTEAAQAVQGSALPFAYAKWESEAKSLVTANQGAPPIPLIDEGLGGTGKGGKGSHKYAMPMKPGTYTLGTPFGEPGPLWSSGYHTGQDFVAPTGTPVYAVAAGTLKVAGHGSETPWAGTYVKEAIAGEPKTNTFYAHLSSIAPGLQPGDTVKKGQLLGKSGATGNVTGPHLHLAFRVNGVAKDPMKFLMGGTYGGGVGSCSGGGEITAKGTAADIIAAGKKWLGTPYSWGGGTLKGPSEGFGPGEGIVGFDCSSLVRYMVYQGTNKKTVLPRTSSAQYMATKGRPVKKKNLQPGDLMFWGTSAATIHHVAMYIGNGKMIEAPHTGATVRIVPIRTSGDYFGATRYLK